MTEEIQRIVRFDERRKILLVVTREKREAKFGEINGGQIEMESKSEYNEEGIKEILKQNQEEEKFLEETIPKIKLKVETAPQITKELEELKEKLILLQRIETKKQQTSEQEKQFKDQLADAEKRMEELRKIDKEILEAIGSRLNLELNKTEKNNE